MAGQLRSVNLGLVKSLEETDVDCQHKHKNSLHRSCCVYLSWKDTLRDQHNNKYSGFTHKGIHGCHNPALVGEALSRREFAVSTHAQGTAFLALPHSQDGELPKGYHKVIHDEGAAFVALLRDCAKTKDLYRGTILHDYILKRGWLEKCSNALVTMYAKCGALAEAQEVLDMHKSRDVFSWTALIAGYAEQGHSQDALNCFESMQREGLSPDAVTFACILKACGTIGAVDKGKQIHDEIAKQGLLGQNIVLGTALIDMYAKCGALAKARCVLEELPSRTVVSWNALITGYAQRGQGEEALNCFKRMQVEGLSPNAVTFICILKACGTLGATNKGEQIHDEIARQGLLGNNIVLGNALVDMYTKCGALSKARRVLEELPSRNVVSWSTLIAGYAQQGQGEQALSCFQCMQGEGIPPNAVTFACILKACGILGAIDRGKQIHDEIARQGLLRYNVVLGNALVDMYAKCGALAKAQRVLEELPSRDLVSWNTLIAGYTQQGQGHLERAVLVIQEMPSSDYCAVWRAMLGACRKWGDVNVGRWAFEHAVQVDKSDGAAYVLMANIYTAAGMQENADYIEGMRVENKGWKN